MLAWAVQVAGDVAGADEGHLGMELTGKAGRGSSGGHLVQHLQEGPALLAWVLLAGKVISLIRSCLQSRLPAA